MIRALVYIGLLLGSLAVASLPAENSHKQPSKRFEEQPSKSKSEANFVEVGPSSGTGMAKS